MKPHDSYSLSGPWLCASTRRETLRAPLAFASPSAARMSRCPGPLRWAFGATASPLVPTTRECEGNGPRWTRRTSAAADSRGCCDGSSAKSPRERLHRPEHHGGPSAKQDAACRETRSDSPSALERCQACDEGNHLTLGGSARRTPVITHVATVALGVGCPPALADRSPRKPVSDASRSVI